MNLVILYIAIGKDIVMIGTDGAGGVSFQHFDVRILCILASSFR